MQVSQRREREKKGTQASKHRSTPIPIAIERLCGCAKSGWGGGGGGGGQKKQGLREPARSLHGIAGPQSAGRTVAEGVSLSLSLCLTLSLSLSLSPCIFFLP